MTSPTYTLSLKFPGREEPIVFAFKSMALRRAFQDRVSGVLEGVTFIGGQHYSPVYATVDDAIADAKAFLALSDLEI